MKKNISTGSEITQTPGQNVFLPKVNNSSNDQISKSNTNINTQSLGNLKPFNHKQSNIALRRDKSYCNDATFPNLKPIGNKKKTIAFEDNNIGTPYSTLIGDILKKEVFVEFKEVRNSQEVLRDTLLDKLKTTIQKNIKRNVTKSSPKSNTIMEMGESPKKSQHHLENISNLMGKKDIKKMATTRYGKALSSEHHN